MTAKARAPKTTPKAPREQVESELPDPVPVGVTQVLDLFKGPLSKISFPDVSSKTLEAACDDLRASDAAVQDAFAALEQAQARLAQEQAQLQRLAERGLAYARVFAQEDDALLEQLNGVELGKKPRKPKAKMIPKAERQKEKLAQAESAEAKSA